MIIRQNWLEKLAASWQLAPIVWLTGVRRVGKTTPAQDVIRQNDATNVQFFNCDLPTVQKRVQDPERFLSALAPGIVVFDEVHQLENPSQLLKIAADEYPALFMAIREASKNSKGIQSLEAGAASLPSNVRRRARAASGV